MTMINALDVAASHTTPATSLADLTDNERRAVLSAIAGAFESARHMSGADIEIDRTCIREGAVTVTIPFHAETDFDDDETGAKLVQELLLSVNHIAGVKLLDFFSDVRDGFANVPGKLTLSWTSHGH